MKLLVKSLLLLLVSVSASNLHAKLQGQAFIDSLLKELPRQKEDTNKVKMFCRLSDEYGHINPNNGIKYGQQGLQLATKLRWKTGMGKSLILVGINYSNESDYSKSLEFLFRALKVFEELGYKRGIASANSNISNVYGVQKDYPKALEYDFMALKGFEESGNKQGVAICTDNIGEIYGEQKDYPKALEYDFIALKALEELGDKGGVANAISNIGVVYQCQKNYIVAVEYYERALKLSDELGDKNFMAVNLANIGSAYIAMTSDTAAKEGKVTGLAELPESKYQPIASIPKGKAALLAGAIDNIQRALAICKEINGLNCALECYRKLTEAYKLKGDYKRAMDYGDSATVMKDSVFSQDSKERIVKLEMKDQYERQRFTDSLKMAEREKIGAIQLQKQKTYTYLGVAGVLVLVGFSFFILKERGKSEKLLLNILPSEVARELKRKGKTEAKNFENVTVLFTDFVNFTIAGERMNAKRLVDELHACFKAFDDITNKYGIEKIKTIGDAYLAVGGLPTADPKHAENTVRAAIEINQFMQDRIAKLSNTTFEVRIGVHSGGLVAGIVGVKKFAYDIWGDTVNTAARMEQSCEPGKINISQTTYELVKDKINCTYRGEIEAKGKGQLKMYYVS